MELGLLRDRTRTTRLLILAGLADGAQTLSAVAKGLGVTVQAVSAHAKHLVRDGMLRNDGGAFAVTPAGFQAIHEGVRELRSAVDALAARFAVIHVTSAVAAAPIAPGDAVALTMEDGELAARPGPAAHAAPSRGRARTPARAGDEVVVGELKGMVELQPGRLTIVAVPGPGEGGARDADLAALRRRLGRGRAAFVGAVGTGAAIVARRLGPEPARFAAERAAFNAAERGLDARLFVSRDLLPDLMATLERLNQATIRRVPVELVDAA